HIHPFALWFASTGAPFFPGPTMSGYSWSGQVPTHIPHPSDGDPRIFPGGHFAHAQLPPTVVCWHRIRGDTPNTCTSGAWYGARASAYRSIPGPTSAYCEGLCGQDRLGRDD